MLLISQLQKYHRERRQRTGDEAWTDAATKEGPLDHLLRHIGDLLIFITRRIFQRKFVYPEIEVLLHYKTSQAEVERIHTMLVQRIAAPKALLPIFVFTIVAVMAIVEQIFEETDITVVVMRVLFFSLLIIATVGWSITLFSTTRLLVEIKSSLNSLNTLRRSLYLMTNIPHSKALGIRSERVTARTLLRHSAPKIIKFTARSANRKPGEPGFEQCTRLGIWIYWTADDVDDVSRIHCAIRVAKRMLFHLMDSNIWEVPEIPKPPNGARVPPPTKIQRIRNGLRQTIYAGFATALFGLVAAVFAFATRLI
ncbi:hypothetical protein [Prauserella marina]|nr:hypothetical protein [Prauserella marina]